MTTNKITINRSDMEMEKMPDDCPDLSYLGEYSKHDEPNAIDRQERGDMERNQFRYFVPTNPEYAEHDYERMEAMNRGAWEMIGIRASVTFQIPSKQGGYWTEQTIHSPGVWGIESDSGQPYFDEVFKEETEVLIEILEALNIEVVN